jgi:5-methyltetrahydrofolate--homocysteine methyltransferase
MGNPNLARWWTLYTKPTKHEQLLEPALASLGRPYRFNHPVTGRKWSFPDFLLLADNVVIEVDGESHTRKGAAEADAERTAFLATKGYRVFRCTNEQVAADPYATVDRLMIAAGLPWRTRKELN